MGGTAVANGMELLRDGVLTHLSTSHRVVCAIVHVFQLAYFIRTARTSGLYEVANPYIEKGQELEDHTVLNIVR